jgi:hypothetical protein
MLPQNRNLIVGVLVGILLSMIAYKVMKNNKQADSKKEGYGGLRPASHSRKRERG